MTELTSLLTDGAGVQPAETALSGADAEIWERSRGRSLTWPVTRLARIKRSRVFRSRPANVECSRYSVPPDRDTRGRGAHGAG